MKSLWPDDINAPQIVAPVAILQEQAKYLGQKTQNIVLAAVYPLKSKASYSEALNFGFYIEAPSLGDYSFRLFMISHEPDPYPVSYHLDEDLRAEIDAPKSGYPATVKANTEEEFINILAEVLQAKKTQRIISSLISQSIALHKPIDDDSGTNEIPF